MKTYFSQYKKYCFKQKLWNRFFYLESLDTSLYPCLSLVSAQTLELRWLTSCCDYMCMCTNMQTTHVSNTPWSCLWGVTSLQESWNVIWGSGGLEHQGFRSSRSSAKGRGVSMLGHVFRIRNLDPPWSAVSCQILLEEEEGKKINNTVPWRLTAWSRGM